MSWAKGAIVLAELGIEEKARRLTAGYTELCSYVENNQGALIDYGQRYRAAKPISISRAEGTVNQLVNACMNKRQQVHWSPVRRPLCASGQGYSAGQTLRPSCSSARGVAPQVF